jgi:hypothetical protein
VTLALVPRAPVAAARELLDLARDRRDAGQPGHALELCRRVTELGGSPAELWYAAYLQATCLAGLGDDAAFVRACLTAFEQRPTRAEPLFTLACHYRARGLHDACVQACELGLRLPPPGAGELHLEDAVYRYGLREQIAISGFYCSDPRMRELGRETCLALAIDRDVPWRVRRQARENCVFYARRADETFGPVELADVRARVAAPYVPLNPSICIDGDRRRFLLRTTNYRISPADFAIRDPDRVVRNQNYLLELDAAYGTLSAPAVVERGDTPPLHPYWVRGLEDGRLFLWRGRWWFTATVRDRNPDGLNEIALCELDGDEADIVSLTLLRGWWSDRHQKNWVPVVDGDRLTFVYSVDPAILLRHEPGGPLVETRPAPPRAALDHLRGGSQAVRIPGGWLYVAHEVAAYSHYDRVYLHRFVTLDEDLRVTALSDPFYFETRSVEFCAGLARDEARGALVASYGVYDRRARLAFFDEGRVMSALRPL